MPGVMDPMPDAMEPPLPDPDFDPDLPSADACFWLSSPALSDGCRDCACNAAPECAEAIQGCDDACWALVRCAYGRCDGRVDTGCVVQACGDLLARTPEASRAMPCASRCAFDCALMDGTGSDAPGGPSDAGAPDPDEDAG